MLTGVAPLMRHLAGAAARFRSGHARTIRTEGSQVAAPQPSPPPPQGDHFSIVVSGDPCASLLAACVAVALKKSLALETRLPAEIFAIPGAGGQRQRAILNNLLGAIPHARYLEVGTQGPGTLCAAMYGNTAHLTCLLATSGPDDRKPYLLAEVAPYRSHLVGFDLLDGDLATVGHRSVRRSNVLLATWDGPVSDTPDLATGVLDDEFILIAEGWNSATVREHVAGAIARASLSPIYDVAVRTTQDDMPAARAGPASDWDQGCRIVVLRRAQLARGAA